MHMVIAVLVLGFSLVCALLVFQRGMIDRSETGSRRWIIAAGIVTGLGVWATHFIALLGYKPGFPVTFDVFVTLMSALVAVIGLTVATAVASNSGTAARKLSAALLGSGTVIVMHYFGMTAMKDSVEIAYDPRLVLLSIVFCVGFYTLAYSFRLSTLPVVRNVVSWACAMLAILGLHFIGTDVCRARRRPRLACRPDAQH